MDQVEKLSMCRMCLAENIRMYAVTDKSLQEMYEKLTNIPFVTEDSRPMLACSFCCTKLQQCCQLQRQCLEAEELFAQMLNVEYEHKPITKERFVGGLIITPIENISIVEKYQINVDAIKEELPEQYDVELKVEHLNEELEDDNLNNSFPNEGIAHNLASVSEDDELSYEIDIEGDEEPKLSGHKEDRKLETAPETKIPKVYKRREKQFVAKMKKNEQSQSRRTQKGRKSASNSTKIKQPSTVTNCKNNVLEKTKENINDLKNSLHMGSPSNTKKIINSNEGNKKNPLFKREVCPEEFTRKSDLKRLSNRHKTTFKLYTCDICQRSFNNKQSLNYHIQTHTSETPFKCILCERSFTNVSSLKFHILTHTGEKPHKCDVCERRFGTKVYLNNHLRTHTGEKPYNCNVCERRFRMKSTLINHVRSHTGEKPFKCDSCPRSFISSSYLTKHNRIHTGEKPFKCDVCERSFTHKTSLQWHNRKQCTAENR